MAYSCNQCDRAFASAESRERHLRDSPLHKYYCSRCDEYFGSDYSLKQHMRDSAVHEFYCNQCDKDFLTAESRRQHMRDSPRDKHRFQCIRCEGRCFRTASALRRHQRKSSRHIVCPRCRGIRSFSTKLGLERHLQYAHRQCCTVCETRCYNQAALDRHHEVEHNKCSRCEGQFDSKNSLRMVCVLCRPLLPIF